MASALSLAGVFPPIATPFNEDAAESVAWQRLQQNVDVWNEMPLRGYVVQGSNGESVHLAEDERVEMVARMRKMAAPEMLVVAGSGCESTRSTVQMSQRMADAGADAVLVVTPSYYKNSLTPAALTHHYTQVADACPVPVILYSVPANTGVDLPVEVIARMAAHANVIGLKDSGGDVAKLASVVNSCGSDFQVLAGSASFLYPAMAVGCVGGVCALANVLGRETCELYSLAMEGRAEEAKKLQQRLVAPNAAVTKRFGVPGLKAAMDWFGVYGGPTRSPLRPLSPDDVTALKKVFADNGFQGND